MARIRTIKPGVGIIHPSRVTKGEIAADELRQGEAVVYRFLDSGGRCIYIGVTESPLNRWQAHRRKPWWPDVHVIHYVAGLEVRRAWEIEREDIDAERPMHNRTVRQQ